MDAEPIHVLLVEDSPADARLLAESLRDAGPDAFRVTHVSRLAPAVEALKQWTPDVIALDLSLPDSSGLDTVDRVRAAAAPGLPVVVLTGLQDEALGLRAVQRGVQDYLVKGYWEGGLPARALRYAVERSRAEQALRESQARSELAQRAGGVGVFDWDPTRGRSVWSHQQEAIYGLPPGGFGGSHDDWFGRVHAEDRAPVRAALDAWFAARRRENEMEYRIVRPDGEVRWVTNRGVATYDDAGRPLRVVGTTVDVTERRRGEDALRDREARLRAVITTAVDAILTIDERGAIDSVNPAAERLFGYAADEMVGRNVSLLMPPPYALEHDRYIADYLRTGRAKVIGIGREVVAVRKDGTTFPIDLSVSEFDAGGGRRMFAGIVHDLSRRRRLEREILEAGAAEQRRIGRELHDGLCQQLTGMSFAAELLARKLKRTGGPAADGLLSTVKTIADELDRAMTETRSLARGLNPVDIRAGGLASALADLAERSSATFGVHCRFRQSGDSATAAAIGDDGAATHLFRIAQEAIANAVRHGKAAQIDIALASAGDGTLTLAVHDDGSGFPAPDLPQDRPGPGIGLRTMEYRARVIGGTLHVGPGPHGAGTAVTCTLRAAGSLAAPVARPCPSHNVPVPPPSTQPPAPVGESRATAGPQHPRRGTSSRRE